MLLSQSIPFLFMGEEYAERAPFHYFVSHSGKALIKMLREEKRAQFKRFYRKGFDYTDPLAELTFEISKLDHSLKAKPAGREILEYYCELIRIRKTFSTFKNYNRDSLSIHLY